MNMPVRAGGTVCREYILELPGKIRKFREYLAGNNYIYTL